MDQRGSADCAPFAYPALWHNNSAHANKRTLLNQDIAPQMRTRCNVNMVGNDVVVIHATTGV
jgi:hypothetical protein